MARLAPVTVLLAALLLAASTAKADDDSNEIRLTSVSCDNVSPKESERHAFCTAKCRTQAPAGAGLTYSGKCDDGTCRCGWYSGTQSCSVSWADGRSVSGLCVANSDNCPDDAGADHVREGFLFNGLVSLTGCTAAQGACCYTKSDVQKGAATATTATTTTITAPAASGGATGASVTITAPGEGTTTLTAAPGTAAAPGAGSVAATPAHNGAQLPGIARALLAALLLSLALLL